MCIIIDANTFSSVFSEKASDHSEFKPVKDWIIRGKGKLVYGGTKYGDELKAARGYLRLFVEFDKIGKTVKVCAASVDQVQQRLEQLVNDDGFDDAHLVAIAIVSGCKLICSKDRSSYPFLKRHDIYPSHIHRPRIYSGIRNKDLLCDKHIAPCCK